MSESTCVCGRCERLQKHLGREASLRTLAERSRDDYRTAAETYERSHLELRKENAALRDMLDRAADTFRDTKLLSRALGRTALGDAMEVAETATRVALDAAKHPMPATVCDGCGDALTFCQSCGTRND